MPKKKDPLVQMRIIALLEEPHMRSPVVILNEPVSDLILPIWIGESEARAIALRLEDVEVSRPLTHTLLMNVIGDLGGKVLRVAVEKIEAGTYFAKIYVRSGRKTIKIDARPSDSIALALEAEAPIFVTESVLSIAGQENPFPADAVARAEAAIKKRDVPQAQAEFSKKEVENLKELLRKAREKEQKGGEGSN
jgi:uncharacterized protein